MASVARARRRESAQQRRAAAARAHFEFSCRRFFSTSITAPKSSFTITGGFAYLRAGCSTRASAHSDTHNAQHKRSTSIVSRKRAQRTHLQARPSMLLVWYATLDAVNFRPCAVDTTTVRSDGAMTPFARSLMSAASATPCA
jgi:hypothetical protein